MGLKKQTKIIIPPEKSALYDRLIAAYPEIERKGATLPYTSVNGNMFSFLSKEGELSLRLSESDREVFVKKYKSKPSIQHGVVMKEYVLVSEALFKKTAELIPWLEKSFGYAKLLKSKKSKTSSNSG